MKKDLTPVARKLRQERNPHEVRLWARLRNRQFFGLKFHRQFPIGRYVVDFCCRERRLVVEVDGGGHAEPTQIKKDVLRDTYLRAEGYKVVRVWSNDVHASIDSVLEYIATFL
ncbi:MAG: endonuclease domain-containing protein [Patescibacteria group bacterium]